MAAVEQERPMPNDSSPMAALWHESAPRHFDLAFPWWFKTLLVAGAAVSAVYCMDFPIARWALAAHPIDERGAWHFRSDMVRELAMLEQWGQWICSLIVIAAVALLDKAGRRRALAIALACLCTVLLTYLLKDLCGRNRPYVDLLKEVGLELPAGSWIWGGPAHGFTGGSKWGSFPSAHTTGAFALAVGLSWFYPRGRGLFMALAMITGAERVLHAAHYLSDVIAGMGIAVIVARCTLRACLAGRVIAMLPATCREWFLCDA